MPTIASAPRRASCGRLSVAVLSAVLAGPFLAPIVAPPALRAQTATPKPAATPAHTDSAKKVLGPHDYGRWRTIGDQSISADGRWVTWVYRFTNVAERDAKPELHILNVDTDEDVTIAMASAGAFSPDARWIVYQVDSLPPRDARGAQGAQGGGAAPGAQAAGRAGGSSSEPLRRVELRELATGRTYVWRDMRSAEFNASSSHLLVRSRAAAGGRGAGRGGPGGGSAAEAPAGGSDAILFDLAAGRGQLLGSAGDAAFNRAGDMLAYTVDAAVKDGNGLFVVDLRSGAVRALDNDARTYARLAWNDAGTGIAVLKGKEVPQMRERDNVLLVIPDLRAALADPKRFPVALDTTAAGFPDGWVVSERSPLSWSEDGARVFLGAMPQTPAKDTVRVESSDTTTDVDVWRTADRYIQSLQMIQARRDRDLTYTQAFDVARGAYVALSDSTLRDLEISPDGRWAVGRDARAYVSDWKPAAADFYRVSTATGERTLMLQGQLVQGARFGISPDGRTYVYWKDDAFHAYELDRGTSVALGAGAPVLVDTTYDHPGPKPPWGFAGWTADGTSVIVADRYDLWTLPLDGRTAAKSITGGAGAKDRIVLRLVRPEPIDSAATRRVRTGEEWDLTRPLTLSAFGETTKRAGYYRLAGGRLDQVVLDDAMYATPARAARADRLLFTRQTFTESPDLRVSGSDLGSAKRVTDSNPQQSEYRWGRSVLFDFTNRYGRPLQGLLWLPDDWEAGQKRPTLVTFYEKNSQILNRYPMPELLVSMGRPAIESVSRGYIVMIPDVHYNTGSSHDDQLDCVEAATRKVIELGYAEPGKIGVHGHSYGGEGAAYIGTRSKLFAAVGAGAGVVDLYADFSQEWGWSYQVNGGSGQNAHQYYVYGQGRWGFSPWDQPDVYRAQSALSHAPEAAQPILIMHGTADPTVSFNESLKFYNALRFNGKTAFLLAYPNEAHHLSKLGNRKDFTIRFYEFFDHYLRGAPEPTWIAEERPFLKKGADARR